MDTFPACGAYVPQGLWRIREVYGEAGGNGRSRADTLQLAGKWLLD